jgi:hypothetical protein
MTMRHPLRPAACTLILNHMVQRFPTHFNASFAALAASDRVRWYAPRTARRSAPHLLEMRRAGGEPARSLSEHSVRAAHRGCRSRKESP